MVNTENFELSIHGRAGNEIISWPILNRTEKAIFVQTPGGTIWLPLWRFSTTSYHYNQLQHLIKLFENVTKNNSNSLLRVWKAGNGKTEKSHKFRTAVQVPGEQQNKFFLKRRTFILPISQISFIEGKWLAPAWLLTKHLDSGETLPNSDWIGLKQVTSQISDAGEKLRLLDEGMYAEQSRRIAEERTQRIDLERQTAEVTSGLQAHIADDGELALGFCKHHFKLPELVAQGCQFSYWPSWSDHTNLGDLKNIAKLVDIARSHSKYAKWKIKQVEKLAAVKISKIKERVPDQSLSNCEVNWVEWGGTSKQRIKVPYNATGCRVDFYGKKREITLQSGVVIVKMEGANLTIVQSEINHDQ